MTRDYLPTHRAILLSTANTIKLDDWELIGVWVAGSEKFMDRRAILTERRFIGTYMRLMY